MRGLQRDRIIFSRHIISVFHAVIKNNAFICTTQAIIYGTIYIDTYLGNILLCLCTTTLTTFSTLNMFTFYLLSNTAPITVRLGARVGVCHGLAVPGGDNLPVLIDFLTSFFKSNQVIQLSRGEEFERRFFSG